MGAERALATLGGGCFWCVEAAFDQVRGVLRVVSGYAGGHVESPTYQAVCAGGTGHAEVVQVEYDPQEVSYRDLLEIFFTVHDPTTLDRQGADEGPQYRSLILHHDEAQREQALALIRELEEARLFDAPIVTRVEPLARFWPAEPMHQKYYARNPGQGYCRVVIAPKLAKLRQKQAHRLK